MSAFLLAALPWVLVAAAVGGFLVSDQAARRRRTGQDGDRGDFWTAVTLLTIAGLGIPLLLSGWLEALSRPAWSSGLHLHFDRTGGWGLHGAAAYAVALALPFAAWAAVLALVSIRAPRAPASARWLAGIAGEPGSRRWILGATLPCLAVLLAAWPHIGGGPHAFPAATWGFHAVVALSLLGVARSAGAVHEETDHATAAPEPAPLPPPPWPDALLRQGIDVSTVAAWSSGETAESDPPGLGSELRERLRERGATSIEEKLIEAVERLLDPTSAGERQWLVQAPDHAGQVEVVAAAAALLGERFHEHTIVIVPREADRVAAALSRWLDPDLLSVVEPGRVLREGAPIRVVDADVLSGWFLPERLREPERLASVGLVVWWGLQDYSGVLAANLWAVSRRLDRLIRRWGRPDVRVLALMRRSAHGEAEAPRFVQSLLPYDFHLASTDVERRFARRLDLHLLSGGPRGEDRGDAPGSRRHLLFQAARASIGAGWRTRLARLPSVPETDVRALLQEEAEGRPLGEQLSDDPAAAAATLLEIDGDDVLSLLDQLARRGRRAPAHLPHHAGLALPENPYARHLLSRLGSARDGAGFSSSRRLVCAEGTPEILRRHLLLALEELPDTSDGLSRAFKRETEIIRQTLDALAEEGQLERREVRYLDEVGKVQPDHLFKSRRAAVDDRRPLTTVGLELIEVVDPAAGQDRRGVRLRVDPERLAIEAYPGRVFLAAGRRYRVRDWGSIEEATERGWIACEEADRHSRTWRLRTPFLHELDPGDDEPVTVSAGASPVSRLVVSARYQERLRGSLRLDGSELGSGREEPRRSELRRAITTTFRTRALLLRFQEPGEPSALPSLAQALRHVLPVHVGIDEDALEVVPLSGDLVRGRPIDGLAIVDLYPGGIGLVNALRGDEDLLLRLLGHARRWLEGCPCGKDDGCPDCLRTPAAQAVSADFPPRRGPALELLREVLD